MARKSAVEQEPEVGSAALDEAWDAPRPRTKKSWSGGGGRWWIWIGRALLWAFVLVVVVNGIRAPFERFTADTPAVLETGEKAPGFPVDAGSSFALQFAQVYLNYDASTSGTRQEQLARFVPEGTDAQFGWNGLGQLSAEQLQVHAVQVRDDHNASVEVTARLGTRWIRLAVPVYADGGRFVVSDLPALLEAPAKAQLPQAPAYEHDTGLEAKLQTDLTGFFQAYAASDSVNLGRYTEGGSTITGLDSTVTFGAIVEVNVPVGDSDERRITATVQWQMQPTESRGNESLLPQTYELTVVKGDGDQWNVRSIRGTVLSGS
ncbi:conjugative transposon protein TcpC [Actinocorallia herbida]|uniref:Conjugative transposon protein TcpC n=1 Tax=Actinocorallia herbida TaxID=58109 RepID=A0A3N1CNE3_9ACTN|nr:conjugal transfer protein [Actinocorallia herbida]ROO82831.1 conjugative transposon protein TcpC [Actinocorallia herbida]